MNQSIFNFLTQNYMITLATSEADFIAVKNVREKVLLPKYKNFAPIEDKEHFLFNADDTQSFIYLLKHLETNEYVGVVRVFFINPKTPIQQLPMQKDGNVYLNNSFIKELPICEVSRLALINNLATPPNLSALQLRTYLSMILMTATRINFLLYHYNKIFAIMEHSLQRILKRQGVFFEPIGNAVDYYGIRFPFMIRKEDFLGAGIKTEDTMGKLSKYYLKQLCQSPDTFWKFIDTNPYLERSDIELDRICKLFKTYGDDVDISLLLGEK